MFFFSFFFESNILEKSIIFVFFLVGFKKDKLRIFICSIGRVIKIFKDLKIIKLLKIFLVRGNVRF